MATEYISKLNKLSPALQSRLSDEKFLAKIDALEEQYGIKAVLLLLSLLLNEFDYSSLDEKLMADYGFNEFLAKEIKTKFGNLIEELGSAMENSTIGNQSEPIKEIIKVKAKPVDFSTSSFSEADEAEVKKYLNLSAEPGIDYLARTRDLMSQFAYQSADAVVAKRLENIVLARVKDIRDDLETKEILLKAHKVGGMEFSAEQADQLLNIINQKAPVRVLAETPKISISEGLPTVVLPAESQLISSLPQLETKTPLVVENKLPVTPNDVKIKTVVENNLPAPQPQPFSTTKKIPESVLNAKTALKPNLDDVKLEKKLYGPIDELANMTIIEFRRLAPEAEVAADKIKEKISLLEKEGFNRRLEGIDAWQKNEVSKFYRLLGQLSMSENKSIEDVIKERLIGGKPTLALEEFNAVMELNRVLRY